MAETVAQLRAAATSAVVDCGHALNLFSRNAEIPKSAGKPSGPSSMCAKMEPRSSQGGDQETVGVKGQACPPHGGKSICGRRPRMEDAYTAYPFLVKVPVPPEDCPVSERLPPRIATQHKEADSTPPGSDSGFSDAEETSARMRQAAALSNSNSNRPHIEALHFFGVFDGHGGAEAAAHCAQTLHQRIAEALTASASPSCRLRENESTFGGADSCEDENQDKNCSVKSRLASSDGATEMSVHSDGSCGAVGDAIIEESLRQPETNPAPADGYSCAESSASKFQAALEVAFSQTDEDFGKADNSALVGTTAVVALVGQRQMYVANCGDSRAVLCRGDIALPLTDDHKAAREDETARVEALGGQILFWNGVRVMGVLAVSRAIGDHCLRPFVIAQPEVTIVTRRAEDELLLLASDGLWDVLSNQEACTLAKRCLKRARQRGASRQSAARIAATVLTRAAIDRGSRDNVTVVVVDLTAPADKPEGAEVAAAEAEGR